MSILDDPRLFDVVQEIAGYRVTARRLREILASTAGQKVLDLGAGTGNLARLLPASADYLALDVDPTKLDRLQDKVPGAQCLLRSSVDTGLPDGSVDWTVCVAIAHHMDDESLSRTVAEMARVTRDRVIFADPLWPGLPLIGRPVWWLDRGHDPRTLEKLMSVLRRHFAVERSESYVTILQRFFLCVGRPLRPADAGSGAVAGSAVA